VERIRGEADEGVVRVRQLSAQLEHALWENAELKKALAGSRLRVTQLEQSLSWKLMAPIRAVGSLFAAKGRTRN
jgi:hypothetical protein